MHRPKHSSIARGAGGGYSPSLPHWHVDQNAEQRKYHVFSTFETVLCSEMDLNSDLKHVLKHIFRRGGGGGGGRS